MCFMILYSSITEQYFAIYMYQLMQLVLEQGFIDKLLTFDIALIVTTQLSYQSVHLIHAKLFSNQKFSYFIQIALWACTSVLFY